MITRITASSKTILLLALACSTVWLPAPVPGAESAARTVSLDQLRASYESDLTRTTDDDLKSRLTLQEQYGRSLEALEKKFQDAGKLEPLLAVRNERQRFDRQKTVTATDIVQDPPELGTCQSSFVKETHNIALRVSRRIVASAQQYDRSLNALQETLTRNGDVEAAIAVKKERDAIAMRPSVQEARAIVTSADTKVVPAEKSRGDEASPVVAETTPAKKPAQSAKKFTGKPEHYIGKRYEKLCDAIVAQKWEKALEYVDPEYIKKRGQDAVLWRLKLLAPILNVIESQPNARLDAGTVKIDASKTAATVTPRIWANNKWTDIAPCRWVAVDGDWYIEIEPIR